jgi:uncharacterized protein
LILADGLETPAPFAAIVADCPFADLLEVAEYRASRQLPVPAAIAAPLSKLSLLGGIVYTRAVHGLDFSKASPVETIARIPTPVLLIHGMEDTRTPPSQSEKLARASGKAELWLVPGARHVGSFRVAREEYLRRMLEWFSRAAN